MDAPSTPAADALEAQIDAWRTHLRRSRAINGTDAEELEDHLRDQIDAIEAAGFAPDEAFLVAVKRMGAVDDLTREFAREHSDRLWKQLVLAGPGGAVGLGSAASPGTRSLWVALALASGAGAAIKLPSLFGMTLEDSGLFYPLNLAFFVLPFLAAYFVWDRAVSASRRLVLGAIFVAAALAVNAFPFAGPREPDTQLLTILHLPIALWLVVGAAYVGGRWRGSERRMDFVRFTGEVSIYYALIGMGGAVLIGSTFGLFEAIGIDAEPLVAEWILPCGIAGAAVIAMWLVEAKQSVIENMAPVLTRVFTPLFALLMLVFLATMAVTGRGIDVEREILIAFDLLLVVVFALLLYSISARDPEAPPGAVDWIQLTLVGTALVVDVLALGAVLGRISDFGFTPNRVAALGENVVLLGNLAGAGFLYLRFLRGRAPFARLLRWQTTYLYVLVGWAAVVAFLFPPLFGFE